MSLTTLMRIYLTRSFKPFEFKNDYNNQIDYTNEQELGLYVHIPFCRSLCSFCPYCKVIYDEALAYQYKAALLKEIELVGSQLKYPKQVTSLYFGGGTPALMANDIQDIISCINKYFIIQDGIGVELHPTDVNEKTLATLKSAGVTMLSLGIQSFQEESLATLGRDRLDHTQVFELINQANFAVIDVDLIFGIPNQSIEFLLSDIKTAFDHGATQISTYPLIDFTFANNSYKPLREKAKKKMLQAITDYCEKRGLERTAVWTFAKKGTNKYSSVTRDSFLGFGVSATTLLKDQFNINTFSLEGYLNRIKANQLPTSLTLNFSLRQRILYYLFWNSYAMKIDNLKFEELFGLSLNEIFGFELWLAKFLGLIKTKDSSYYLTDKGAYYYHYIEQAYTTAYIDKMWNVSRKIAFPEKIILN